MTPNQITSTLLAAILLALPACSAPAGDYNSSHRHGGYHAKWRPSIGYTNPVSRIRGVGTFSSSSWAFNLDRVAGSIRDYRISGPQLAPKAKVIDVESEPPGGFFNPRNACSYEMGVCVIRGDR